MPRSATSSALSTRGILLTLDVLAAVALVVYLYTVFRPASDADDADAQCLLQQTPKTYKTCNDVRHKDDCGDCDECGWCAFADGSGRCVPGGAAGPYDEALADQCVAYWYRGRCMWGDDCPSASAPAAGGWWWDWGPRWDWGFGPSHSSSTTVVVKPPSIWATFSMPISVSRSVASAERQALAQ